MLGSVLHRQPVQRVLWKHDEIHRAEVAPCLADEVADAFRSGLSGAQASQRRAAAVARGQRQRRCSTCSVHRSPLIEVHSPAWIERAKPRAGMRRRSRCGSPALRSGFSAVLRPHGLPRNLASLPAVVALEQSRRVRSRSALGARGHASSAPRRRICRCRRTPARGVAGTTDARIVTGHERHSAAGGALVGATCGAASIAAARSARATRALPLLTRGDCPSATTAGVKRVSPRERAARSAAESACKADRHSREPTAGTAHRAAPEPDITGKNSSPRYP